MKTLNEYLRKAEIYPFNATPYVSQHIEDEAIKAFVAFLKENKEIAIPACEEDIINVHQVTVQEIVDKINESVQVKKE